MDRASAIKIIFLFCTLCFLVFAISAVHATPYRPDNDSEVVETLTVRWLGAGLADIRQLRTELGKNPENVINATLLARKYIQLARQRDDPRYYGYAESVLSPWWNKNPAPPSVLILSATIKQHFHQFKSALVDLDQLLKLDPSNGQAWLTQAVVQQVTGQPKKALKSCSALLRLAHTVVTATCLSNTLSLQGRARQAYQKLLKVYKSTDQFSSQEETWVLTSLAEIAQRLGYYRQANRHFRSALTVDRNDGYLNSSFADHLLSQGEYRAVVKLLENKTNNNAHLLRLVLAEQSLELPSFDKHKQKLISRYNADARRGSPSHLRDRARFHLIVLNQPTKALSLAVLNWQQQKEPDDAQILLQSSIQAGSAVKAQSVLRWMQVNKIEDVKLNKLKKKIEAMT